MLQGGTKMKNTRRILSLLVAVVLSFTMIFTLTACKDSKKSNKPNSNSNHSSQNIISHSPAEDDLSGWFSLEVINQYSMAPFVQPPGTTVVSKPERDCLYLTGNQNTFTECTKYAFETIARNNKAVYLPVKSNDAESILDYNEITSYDFSTLYPKGDNTNVTFIYTLGHKAYECSLSYDTDTEQVCISFTDRTNLYREIIR